MDNSITFVEWASLYSYSKEQVKECPVEHPLKDMGKKTILLQENTSIIKMLKGGKQVCGQRTQNIHIRYFYAHKRVTNGTIVVTYCPTKEMVSAYLSKPLQGSLFRVHCNNLMGITSELDAQYKLSYAKEKVLRVKAARDHLSVKNLPRSEYIIIYIYIYIYIYTYTHP